MTSTIVHTPQGALPVVVHGDVATPETCARIYFENYINACYIIMMACKETRLSNEKEAMKMGQSNTPISNAALQEKNGTLELLNGIIDAILTTVDQPRPGLTNYQDAAAWTLRALNTFRACIEADAAQQNTGQFSPTTAFMSTDHYSELAHQCKDLLTKLCPHMTISW